MDFYFLLYCHVSTSDCNINSTTAVVVVVILKQISFCVSVVCWWSRGEDADIRLQWSTIMKHRTSKSVRSISAPIFLIPSAVILIVCRIILDSDCRRWVSMKRWRKEECLHLPHHHHHHHPLIMMWWWPGSGLEVWCLSQQQGAMLLLQCLCLQSSTDPATLVNQVTSRRKSRCTLHTLLTSEFRKYHLIIIIIRNWSNDEGK